MSETMLEELGGMRKQTVKLVRNSHPYIHFYTKSSYISLLRQTTHRLLIHPSHLIEDIHLAPTNRNQVVKTGALRTASFTSICSLTVRFPVHLAAARKKKPAYVDGVGLSKRIGLKKSPRLHASVESIDFLNGQAGFADI